jgi:Tfp pilus assembly protein PilO
VKPFWRRRLLVPALALLALNVVAYAAYTRPRAVRERDIAARAVVLREEVAVERARVARVRERARTISANAADVTRFYEAIGGKGSVLAVQEDVVALGRQLGLAIGNRSYANDPVKGSRGLTRFRITMPVAGSYRQVATFLRRIEEMRHFVTVDQIALREDSGAAGRATNLNVVLSVYFQDEEAGDAAAS